jgi:hypothetical protein
VRGHAESLAGLADAAERKPVRDKAMALGSRIDVTTRKRCVGAASGAHAPGT